MGGMQRGPFVIHSKHGPFQLICRTLPHASVNLPVINAEEDTISPPSGIMVTTSNFVSTLYPNLKRGNGDEVDVHADYCVALMEP